MSPYYPGMTGASPYPYSPQYSPSYYQTQSSPNAYAMASGAYSPSHHQQPSPNPYLSMPYSPGYPYAGIYSVPYNYNYHFFVVVC